jgi:hypothetical protein
MEEKSMNKPIMQTLKELEKGKTASFSLDRVLSVRSVCSLLSLQNGLKFKTKSDRETRTVTVEKL